MNLNQIQTGLKIRSVFQKGGNMTTVFTNAYIYTADDKNPTANTVAVEGDKIIYAGTLSGSEVEEKFKGAKILDLKGKMIIPGIIDSHTHPGMVSQSSWHITMPWTMDVNELLDFVREYAEKTPVSEAPFLYFEYYPTEMFDKNGPTKELLDSAVSDRPCLCNDFTEHQHWMNSKMIELLGVTKDTPDPVPGLEMFERDENGEPTGWAKDWAWQHFEDNMYEKIGWRPPTDLTPELMTPYFRFNTEHGITAIADARLEGESQIKSIYELDKAGRLNCYYDGIVRFWSLGDLPEKIAELRKDNRLYSTKHIKFNTVKLFLDGTNEGGNSALLAPHENDPEGLNFGEGALPYLGREKWERMYQFNPIIESGALVTFSSDCVSNYELHRADPFLSMQIAHTRVDPEVPLDPEKYPGSVRPPASAKISRENLLKGYTINGARQLRWDHVIGSIEEGKAANFSVVSDNFLEVDADKIKDITFESVIFEGKVVYGKKVQDM